MNEFRVGLLALASLTAVVIMSLKITSNQSGFGEYSTYRTVLKDASGIFPKTPIKIAGISAGKIKNIHLEGTNAMVTFEVLKRIPIPKGSRLRINTVGFLGDKYLEIVLEKGEDYVLEGGFLISEDGAGFQKIINDASEVVKDIKEITESLKKTIAPTDGEPPIKRIIMDVKDAVANIKEVTVSLKNIVAGNEEKINTMVADLEEFSGRLNNELDKNQEGSTISDVKDILDNAKKMTDDLKIMVANIREGKGTLGKIMVEEEIADEVKQTISGVRRIVTRLNTLRTEMSMYTGQNTDYGSESFLNFRFFPAPERFYLFGVTTSEFGPEYTREFNKEIDGNKSKEIWRTRRKDTYRFNLQLGRRVQNWTLRGGVIESTGGMAVDYEWVGAGTTFSAELFDYRDKIGANLRLSSEIQLWSVLYGRGAVEEVTNKNRSASIFLGLKFTDEDIRGLLGMFL